MARTSPGAIIAPAATFSTARRPDTRLALRAVDRSARRPNRSRTLQAGHAPTLRATVEGSDGATKTNRPAGPVRTPRAAVRFKL